MNEHRQTIQDLVENLEPTGPPPNAAKLGFLYAFSALCLTAAVMWLIAPFRDGFVQQLATTPRFALETVLGVVAFIGMAQAAFALGIPDIRSHWRRYRIPIAALTVWIALFIFALSDPVFAPSMAGKRALCFLEVLIYAIPLSAVGVNLLHRWLPLEPAKAGVWTGIAAGLVPAFLMQFACMHEPWHIITHHIFPIAGSALIGGLIGYIVLRNPR